MQQVMQAALQRGVNGRPCAVGKVVVEFDEVG